MKQRAKKSEYYRNIEMINNFIKQQNSICMLGAPIIFSPTGNLFIDWLPHKGGSWPSALAVLGLGLLHTKNIS